MPVIVTILKMYFELFLQDGKTKMIKNLIESIGVSCKLKMAKILSISEKSKMTAIL